ncbi:MAG: HAD family phosphatase [bacterium]
MEIKAFIFDMDELMVDSFIYHGLVFAEVFKPYGIIWRGEGSQLTPEIEAPLFGLSIKDIFTILVEKFGLTDQADPAELLLQYNEQLIPVFERENIQPKAGLAKLVGDIAQHNYPVALASSASHKKIEVILRKIGLAHYFPVLVSGEDEIKHGKPAPDIFLKAAERLKISPQHCVVFEDAENGVKAAKAAGMKCIGVHNQTVFKVAGKRQDLSQADLEVESLTELTVAKILRALTPSSPRN